MTTSKENKKNKTGTLTNAPERNKHSGLTAFMLIAIVMLAGGLVYVGTLNRSLNSANAQVATIADSANTIKKISNYIELPSDENPTVAQINDVAALKQANPDFYAQAKNGDLLVVYTSMALIYRDATDKLIKVAPVIIHEDTSNVSGEGGGQDGDGQISVDGVSSKLPKFGSGNDGNTSR